MTDSVWPAGEFVAQVPYHPPLQQAAAFTPERCIRVLEAAAGVPLPDACIRSVRPWTMHAEVATSYAPSLLVSLMFPLRMGLRKFGLHHSLRACTFTRAGSAMIGYS